MAPKISVMIGSRRVRISPWVNSKFVPHTITPLIEQVTPVKSAKPVLLLLTLFSLSFSVCLAENPKPEQPNILFIFADDYSYDCVHATGNNEVMTPNIDSIARQGTEFSRAYNMGGWNGAVCIASRTMLNTGRFIWTANNLDQKKERQANRFWSLQMKQAGYETYFTGKWHVKTKPNLIFDHVGSVRGGMPKQTPEGYNRPVEGQEDVWSPFDKSKGGFWQGGKHWSEVVGDETVGFLDNAAQSEKPFFMYVAFNAPHDPRQSPKEFVDKYPLENISVPPNFLPEYPYKDAMGNSKKLRDEKLAPFPRTEYSVKVNRQEYYAIITHMDQQIGRILDHLKTIDKADNTYIVFTADHGLSVGHHGLIGKQNMYEHSVRVPFFIAGPDIPAGRTIENRIYLQDVVPTTMELATGKVPSFVKFKSLVPMIQSQINEHYRSIYGGYINLQRMVIQDNMKLILYPEAKKIRLYNLENDPLEMNDLAQDPKFKQVIQDLFNELLELQKETEDVLDLKEIFGHTVGI
ncbi:MAG: sulfatase-like hydrolase/transferase [Planctomycetota bacterium]